MYVGAEGLFTLGSSIKLGVTRALGLFIYFLVFGGD
jgi:hypothetical protein